MESAWVEDSLSTPYVAGIGLGYLSCLKSSGLCCNLCGLYWWKFAVLWSVSGIASPNGRSKKVNELALVNERKVYDKAVLNYITVWSLV